MPGQGRRDRICHRGRERGAERVDAATPGATVKIAGTCTGVSNVGVTARTAHIAKDLTLEGGYASDSWDVSDPVAHPTTLDADHAGRGVYIAANATVTLRNLSIANGFAADNGGGFITRAPSPSNGPPSGTPQRYSAGASTTPAT